MNSKKKNSVSVEHKFTKKGQFPLLFRFFLVYVSDEQKKNLGVAQGIMSTCCFNHGKQRMNGPL